MLDTHEDTPLCERDQLPRNPGDGGREELHCPSSATQLCTSGLGFFLFFIPKQENRVFQQIMTEDHWRRGIRSISTRVSCSRFYYSYSTSSVSTCLRYGQILLSVLQRSLHL